MSRKKTHDEFICELQNINNKVDVLGRYQTAFTPIE